MQHLGKPTALLSADWHLRSTIPSCRENEFYKSMLRKVKFLCQTAKAYGVPILIAGDVGHTPQWENSLLYDVITEIKKHQKTWVGDFDIFAVPGQHDLPLHSLRLWPHSGIGVLDAAEAISVLIDLPKQVGGFKLYPYPYSNNRKVFADNNSVALMHKMVIKDEPLWEGQQCISAKELLAKFPEHKLIVTGDNHIPFTETLNGRLLVNCGSLMRTTTLQALYKPRVYLWYSESNTVEEIYIPLWGNTVIRYKDDDIKEDEGSFVKMLEKDFDLDISFEENMKRALSKQPVSKPVAVKIYVAMTGGK